MLGFVTESKRGSSLMSKEDLLNRLVLVIATSMVLSCRAFVENASAEDDVTVTQIPIGDTWMFFGDSETAGPADESPTAVSQAVAFHNIWMGTFDNNVSLTVEGISGGASIQDTYDNYQQATGTVDATWINFQESGLHGPDSGLQTTSGQDTAEEFGDTFEAFIREIAHNSPRATISVETAFTFVSNDPDRDWTEYNAELKRRVAALANDGITVYVAEVAADIEALIASVGRNEVIQSDDLHYTGLGNLMVALSIYDALNYPVADLELALIADSDVAPSHKQAAIDVITN